MAEAVTGTAPANALSEDVWFQETSSTEVGVPALPDTRPDPMMPGTKVPLMSGGWTATKPPYCGVLYGSQPAPPPGFELLVPNPRPLMVMKTCPGLAQIVTSPG